MLTSTKEKDYIFISYSRKDSNRLQTFFDALDKVYNIWYDKNILPGKEWDVEVADKLANSSYFFLIVSDNSMNSKNCMDEITFARDHNIPIINMYLDPNVELSNVFELRFNRYQFFKLYEYLNKADSLISNLESIIGNNIIKCRKVNNIITFGKYYINSNCVKEPVEWHIINSDAETFLLVSKYIIDVKEYHTYQTLEQAACAYWEASHLRKWMNKFLFNELFEDYEKKMIITRNKTFSNGVCEDNIFLLSLDDIEKISNKNIIKTRKTQYAMYKGCLDYWWLEDDKITTGYDFRILCADLNGEYIKPFDDGFRKNYIDSDTKKIGIRPAILVKKSILD